MTTRSCLLLPLSLSVWLVSCSASQFATLTVYETPSTFVRLEVDRTVGPQAKSHPAIISPERMAAVLNGITVNEPATRLPLYDDLSIPRRHQAFSEDQVAFWSPVLVAALAQATPEEVVTFYHSHRVSGVKREVTSGGLFVVGDELHILLSNYRSETHAAADIGVADTDDERLTPMRSLAPQRGALDFQPATARRRVVAGGVRRLFEWDRRELVILYGTLQPAPLSTTSLLSPSGLPDRKRNLPQ